MTQVMRLLRGEPDAVSVVDGYVVIEVFPVVGAALAELQSMGILPDRDPAARPVRPGGAGRPRRAASRPHWASRCRPTFGTIRLMPADRLLTARTVVRVLDISRSSC